jgi:hypothetical protein
MRKKLVSIRFQIIIEMLLYRNLINEIVSSNVKICNLVALLLLLKPVEASIRAKTLKIISPHR